MGSSLSDCNERWAAGNGGEGDRSIGKDMMELLEKGPQLVGGLFIIVDDDDDCDSNNDEVVVADLDVGRRVAVKHRASVPI